MGRFGNDCGVGETGEGDESGRAALRKLIVTRLEEGSVGGSRRVDCSSGVCGVEGPVSIFMAESLGLRSSTRMSAAGELELTRPDLALSADRLREPPETEVRRRFLEASSPSVKGFGLVELGSEETARSGASEDTVGWSIWLTQRRVTARVLELQRRHSGARDDSAAAGQN